MYIRLTITFNNISECQKIKVLNICDQFLNKINLHNAGTILDARLNYDAISGVLRAIWTLLFVDRLLQNKEV